MSLTLLPLHITSSSMWMVTPSRSEPWTVLLNKRPSLRKHKGIKIEHNHISSNLFFCTNTMACYKSAFFSSPPPPSRNKQEYVCLTHVFFRKKIRVNVVQVCKCTNPMIRAASLGHVPRVVLTLLHTLGVVQRCGGG